MKCAYASINEADSKERSRASSHVEGILFDRDKVSALGITIILTHKAQGTRTCTYRPQTLITATSITGRLTSGYYGTQLSLHYTVKLGGAARLSVHVMILWYCRENRTCWFILCLSLCCIISGVSVCSTRATLTQHNHTS